MASSHPARFGAAGLAGALVLAFGIGAASQTLSGAQAPQGATAMWPVLQSELARLTPTERYLGTLFPGWHTSGGSIVDERQSVESTYEINEDETYRTVPDYLRHEACASDVRGVFAGTVAAKRGLPLDDGSFLITAYTLRLTEVWRSPAERTLHVGDTTDVATPGGQMVIGGVTIRATSNRAPVLDVGDEAVFFADFHPAFRAFHTTEPVFRLTGARARLAAPSGPPIVLLQRLTDQPRGEFDERLQASTCR